MPTGMMTGGSMMVTGRRPDSVPVSIMASPGEQIDVWRPDQGGGDPRRGGGSGGRQHGDPIVTTRRPSRTCSALINDAIGDGHRFKWWRPDARHLQRACSRRRRGFALARSAGDRLAQRRGSDNIVATRKMRAIRRRTSPIRRRIWNGGARYDRTISDGHDELCRRDRLCRDRRHNFASAEIPVSIEGFIDGVWTEIVEEVMLPDDGPALFRFTAQSLSRYPIRMQAGTDEPRAAVVYVGKLLVIERKVYAGHMPMTDGIKVSRRQRSKRGGNFLGRIVLGEWRETTIPLSLISPAWFPNLHAAVPRGWPRSAVLLRVAAANLSARSRLWRAGRRSDADADAAKPSSRLRSQG
jgi:hypothetical protein